MCQYKSTYSMNQSSDGFTIWVRNNIICNLFDKFIGNSTVTNTETTATTATTATTNIIGGISDEDDSFILATLLDTYIPQASLLPWPYRLLHPPYRPIVRSWTPQNGESVPDNAENTENTENASDETF